MQEALPPISIMRAVATTALPALGITQGKSFYLVHERASGRFEIVTWDRVHWLCSCGCGSCPHKLAVNDLLVQEVLDKQQPS
jgi:hypothetical protein